jgi:hypothetical protein
MSPARKANSFLLSQNGVGHGDPPAFADLVANLNGKLQRPVKVNLDIIPATSLTAP